MKINDIRAMETGRLQETLIELREKAREARFGVANRQVKNVRELRALKRDIASILTILNERTSSETIK